MKMPSLMDQGMVRQNIPSPTLTITNAGTTWVASQRLEIVAKFYIVSAGPKDIARVLDYALRDWLGILIVSNPMMVSGVCQAMQMGAALCQV